jgi:uncharacterized protein YndB with AHSA1/START domain
MTRDEYSPGPADLATVQKEGDNWTLVLVKELRHSPEKVWEALTDPAQLSEWAPFDANKSLGTVGPVTLTVVGMDQSSQTEVTRADAPNLLEYKWGDQDFRWQLEALGQGTRLTLWHNIDRRFIAMGAAGWQVCLDVMNFALDGQPIGRIVAGDALKFEGWQRLHKEYAAQFGVETPSW